ncbi:MAG TPA: ferritin-like domain-containing protein [Chloroflexota bacterium]|nr:ferritin-like domain-containing protein [Chloroflexota bacterium]
MTTTAPLATTNPWLHPLAEGNPPPLSERLIRALEAHQAAEAADVASCLQVAQRLGDPVADLLVGMIVEDEQRHDALLRSMIRRLHEEVEFVAAPDAVPVLTEPGLGTAETAADIAASIRGLMRNEHEGSRHLRHLARQEPTLYGGLYPLLLETIARDSEKHATILRYLLHEIEGRTG